jgi:hypothetical protein
MSDEPADTGRTERDVIEEDDPELDTDALARGEVGDA